MAAVMEFGVLGPVEIWVDGRSTDAGHARQRAVLAVLLLDMGLAVPLETLIDRVWGEHPPRSARNVAYGYVSRLKALIVSGQDPDVTLSRRSGGYVLQAGPDRVDVCRFRRLVAEAGAAGGGDALAGDLLGEAVALWRGTALAGLDSPWLNGQRATMELERTAAMLDLNDIRLRRGEHGRLAGELTGRAAASPADERLIGQLMLALYRCGRQAEALRWFEQTRRHLADELGADPGPELRTLHEQILRADQSLAVMPGGAYRAAAPVPHELPADVPAFTGRVAELAELDRLLTGPAGRGGANPATTLGAVAANGRVTAAVISAVSGTAGVGKTALAVHWAHRAADRFPDGQLYVNLRGYDPGRPMAAADALAGFLRTLGWPGQDIPPGQDERAARYRSLVAGKQMLIVLDNASQAEQVRPLLPGTPACAVVVTSRDALPGLVARNGAARLELDLLPLPEAVALMGELIGERARAAPGAAAALAGHCCRLPLALRVAAELAAARPDVPLTDLVAELAGQQGRLDLLDAAGDPRTAVRAVFSWSCRHLDADAARAFRFLGLHPGPDFDPYATAALTDGPIDQARQALAELARAHLIESAPPDRYRMHDLLRAYASELAGEHDSDEGRHAALTRLFDHYLGTAATAMDAIWPGERHRRPRIPAPTTPVADPSAARAWLDSERAGLVAITAHAAVHGWPDHATRISATLYRYLDNGGFYAEAAAVHGYGRSGAHLVGDRTAEATALSHLANADWRQARYQRAAGHLRLALGLFREAGDRDGQARALNTLGMVDFYQGSYPEAAGHLRLALGLFREAGDRDGQARVLSNLAGIDQVQGRYPEAAGYLRRALALFCEVGYRVGQAGALNNLGIIDERQGHYERAAEYHRQALVLYREVGYRVGQAHALRDLGVIDQRQGRLRQGIDQQQQALDLFREAGDRAEEVATLNVLGEAFLSVGQPESARAEHAAALSLASEIGNKHEQACAHNGLGRAYDAAGDQDQARQHWQQALSLFTELGTPEADEVRARLAAGDKATAAE
jgi:DNA-binding SARP family transcriptional activator/Tfp pilus assembly protein PilF